MRPHHRRDRRLPGTARGRGVGRADDARRAGAARLRGAQGCVRAARLRRPDRAHVQPAGRSRRGLGAVQAGRRPRSPAAGRGAGHRAGAVAHRARADRGVLRRRDGARRRIAPCSPSATASSRSIRSRAPTSMPSTSRTGCCASAWRRRASPGGTRRWTCRSAPRGRCWNWWIACSPIRLAAAGVVDAGRYAHALRRSGGPCRRGGAVAARAAARCGGTGALDGAGPEPRPDLGAAASGGDAGAMDRARGRRRRDAGEQGTAARPRRRDGAGASQERFRPRPGARAEVARRAGGRAGPADADRAAGGAGPDGARRCAAAAAGRPDLRLPADQPARRTVRRQPDGSGDRAERAVVGDAARAGRGAAGLAGGLGVLCGLAGAGRLRVAARAVRRGAGAARRAGAAVCPARPGSRRTGGRTAERGAGLWPHAPAVAAGVPALAAPLGRGGEARGGRRRQPGAGDDGARRQGIAGAAGDPAGHHVAAAGRGVDPVGDRSGHRARRADLVAAAGGALRRRPASCATRRSSGGWRSTTGCSTSR